ncbi:MAG TPA: pyridoxine 5'-phosphate synthase, partial [Candidatus Omnitrophota bacterium]|nr:pyridoxine 5'-phosphate synthase [Candidatus Omnitrophota bacterium]
HIQDRDVFQAKKRLKIKFNLEMSVAPSIVDIALRARPDQVTLVPERRQERTTEGGLDLYKKRAWLGRCVGRFQKKKIGVSFFIDPDDRQIVEARRLGAGAIELHTGDYADASTPAAAKKEWDRLYRAAIFARQLGLVTHAGHGLDYKNVAAMKKIKGLEELNIGYSIVTRAVWVGLDQAVNEMLKAIR